MEPSVRNPVSVRRWASLINVSCTAMQVSSQLYMDAINILADQDEGKEALSGDLFRQAIGMCPFMFCPA